jgi:hypothetical protein
VWIIFHREEAGSVMVDRTARTGLKEKNELEQAMKIGETRSKRLSCNKFHLGMFFFPVEINYGFRSDPGSLCLFFSARVMIIVIVIAI